MKPKESFDLKFDRAEKHLVDLKRLIAEYVSGHPYAMSEGRKTKRNPNSWRLTFTAQPDETISIVVGDFIHNIRSGLDHLAASLVPKNRRHDTMFPIMRHGVWEPFVPGEDKQRTEDRAKWVTFTTKMHPKAIAILQQLQPGEPRHDGTTLDDHSMPGLIGLNRLSNYDKHSKLIVTAVALGAPIKFRVEIDGELDYLSPLENDLRRGFPDDAEFPMPEGAMNVEVEGTPRITVRITYKNVGYVMPEVLEMLLRDSRMIGEILRPYLWVKK